jgi:Fe-S oxidoreductase
MPDHDPCTECGVCFTQCPAAQYATEKAVDEIRALKRGDNAYILSVCITCMACNEYCPNEAHPFDLISRLQERYGVSLVSEARAEMIEAMLASMPKRIVAGDAALPVLSLCVMEHALPPDTAGSLLFENLTVVSGSPFYSRVVHLHTGLPSLTRKHAAGFIENLAGLGRQEIVFAHDDCYVMAAVLAPAYGISVPFAPVHLAEWLGRVLAEKDGQIRKLKKKIAFQRPCITRLAPWTEKCVDTVFKLAGVERVQRVYDREHARCCGIGLAEKFADMSAGMVAGNIADALQYGAEAMVFGCPSCYAYMCEACMAAGLAPVFITDLARMALGEIPFEPRPHIKRDAA